MYVFVDKVVYFYVWIYLWVGECSLLVCWYKHLISPITALSQHATLETSFAHFSGFDNTKRTWWKSLNALNQTHDSSHNALKSKWQKHHSKQSVNCHWNWKQLFAANSKALFVENVTIKSIKRHHNSLIWTASKIFFWQNSKCGEIGYEKVQD